MPRLVVVSNRVSLPDRDAQAGGLAIALKGALASTQGVWFGWSGKVATPGPAKVVESDGVTYVTVDLGKADHQEFYNGFANRVLWPILHYRLDLVEFTRRGPLFPLTVAVAPSSQAASLTEEWLDSMAADIFPSSAD